MIDEYDPARRESLFHAALIYSKKIATGTKKGDRELRTLLEQYSSFEQIFKEYCGSLFLEERLTAIPGLEKVQHRLETLGFDFRVLTIRHPDFPNALQADSEATPVLYTRGETGLFRYKTMGVVGTRQLNDERDRRAGENVIERLVEKDYAIVSGLAAGCDALVHTTTMKQRGRTIAVLGTSLDRSYPKENRELQERIASEQLLVSQYPIGIRSFPSFFVHRNTTTVGLSTDGILVIRAGDRSGAQYAIRECLEKGKQLYVLENNLRQGYQWIERYRGRFKVPNR